MTETITIPLNKLDADPKNVRKTHSAEGVEALAASIRTDGYRLLQNLVVRKGEKKGRYFVTAGGGRRTALVLLAEAGEIAKDFPVECKESGEDATGISLSENVLREESGRPIRGVPRSGGRRQVGPRYCRTVRHDRNDCAPRPSPWSRVAAPLGGLLQRGHDF
ncbi:ParB/Srx family N-terminal domain-containing protein [Mesorhizobium sp.]|uniref:ParB/Srx family N-terminal domain-containing protein n=1 Tax=Mesorhizobium sp. TaxID=1871066 RepID=UPI0025EC1A34|nr:ParB/Srx family N-terminal domain-containing protein [Mesorhizobium sp.]